MATLIPSQPAATQLGRFCERSGHQHRALGVQLPCPLEVPLEGFRRFA